MSVAGSKSRGAGWPWVIGVGIVAGLVVAAWFLGEWVGGSVVTSSTHTVVITQASAALVP